METTKGGGINPSIAGADVRQKGGLVSRRGGFDVMPVVGILNIAGLGGSERQLGVERIGRKWGR